MALTAAVAGVLVGLLGGCSSGGGPSPGGVAAPPGAIVLTLDGHNAGRSIPAGFLGLGIEYRALGREAGSDPTSLDPALLQLIANLSPGQSPVIRVGGDTTDWSWWPVAGLERPPGVHYTITPAWLALTRALTHRLGARLIVGVNLEADSAKVADSEAEALINGIDRQSIAALELGNEPELYHSFGWYRRPDGQEVPGRPAGYNFAMFSRQFTSLAASLPAATVAGPATGGPWWEPDWPRFLAAEPRVGLATVHRYPLHACSNRRSSLYPTIANLLSPAASAGLAVDTRPLVAEAHARGIPLRVDEMNPTPCPAGALRMRSFAGALWAADVLFQMASVGVDGVNVQSTTGPTQDLFTVQRRPTGWRIAVRPEYYGLLLFADAAPVGSRLVPFAARPTWPIEAWATRSPDRRLRVVLINQSSARHVAVLRLGFSAGPASLARLLAPGVAAQHGVTLGGLSFGTWTETGRLAGVPTRTMIQPSRGSYVVALPGDSAALLTTR